MSLEGGGKVRQRGGTTWTVRTRKERLESLAVIPTWHLDVWYSRVTIRDGTVGKVKERRENFMGVWGNFYIYHPQAFSHNLIVSMSPSRTRVSVSYMYMSRSAFHSFCVSQCG